MLPIRPLVLIFLYINYHVYDDAWLNFNFHKQIFSTLHHLEVPWGTSDYVAFEIVLNF